MDIFGIFHCTICHCCVCIKICLFSLFEIESNLYPNQTKHSVIRLHSGKHFSVNLIYFLFPFEVWFEQAFDFCNEFGVARCLYCVVMKQHEWGDKMSIDDKTFALSYDAYLKNRKRNKRKNTLQAASQRRSIVIESFFHSTLFLILFLF